MQVQLPALLPGLAGPGDGRYWLTNARLFDGTGAAVRDARGVLVE